MMEYRFVRKGNNDRLILCMLGWASAPEFLHSLETPGCDVLAVYDYRETECPEGLKEIVDSYSQFRLMGWSFGVYMAEKIAKEFKKPEMSLAVNGTSRPCDSRYGIPPKSLELTVRSIAGYGMERFYGRMCGENSGQFMPSGRDVSELSEELATLSKIFKESDNAQFIWSDAVIGTGDVIFPFGNMKKFWDECSPETNLVVADIPHYPFTKEGIQIISGIIGWKERNL